MFKDKIAIVTGSAAGIGAVCARKLAEGGAKVVINYSKSEAEAREVEKACAQAGASAIVVQGDVSKDEDCRRLAQAALDAWGRIDILINNAGTTKFANHAKLDELDAEDFASIYAVNVTGAYQMIRSVAPSMRTHGDGRVVNISSIAGVAGVGSSVAYAASKGALNTMTLSLARSLAPAIRVNAICPGFVGTRWFRDRFGEEAFARMVKEQEARTPLNRSGTPEDVADATLFFASQWSRHITGETLLVDAGMHLDLAPLIAR